MSGPATAPSRIPVRRHPALVVGSGVAGMSVALGLRTATIIGDTALGEGGSSKWAQGGVAVAMGSGDTPQAHAADTLAVSAGLGVREVTEILTAGGPDAIRELIELGATFDRRADGSLSLGREAGHGTHRIIHANGDATGAEMVRALVQATLAAPGIDLLEGHVALDLIRDGDRVVGVLVRNPAGDLEAHIASAVVLATGGYAHLFARTTTPSEVVGAGIAMAVRAGAEVADMEFVQFHPTALATAEADPAPLLTEALRGEGAILVDDLGRRFMVDEHPDAELAPRDVVARANFRQIQEGRQVFLDATEVVGAAFPERFPTVYGLATRHGIDPRTELMPVSPAAHYCMGGIAVDAAGRTSVTGLWAAGEVTSSGLHGANRLASNSLLEGLVMGRLVADDIGSTAEAASTTTRVELPTESLAPDSGDSIRQKIREILWRSAGVVRTGAGLAGARDELDRLTARAAESADGRNCALVAGLVISAAESRCESRGAHYRADMPLADADQAYRRFQQLPVANASSYELDTDQLVARPTVSV